MQSSAVRPRALEGSQQSSTWPDFRHVGHGAAGVEIGQDDLLAVAAEDVGAFGHEVDAAEDDVASLRFRRRLGELVGVAGEICEAHDFVALVVVAKNDVVAPNSRAGGRDAVVHGVVGQGEIVLERAS